MQNRAQSEGKLLILLPTDAENLVKTATKPDVVWKAYRRSPASDAISVHSDVFEVQHARYHFLHAESEVKRDMQTQRRAYIRSTQFLSSTAVLATS